MGSLRARAHSMKPIEAQLAVFQGPHQPFVFTTRPVPTELGSREVLVSLELATICGSDLHTADGRRTEPFPSVLGHEAVGRILALGPGRPDLRVGERVTWSIADSCGCCPACTDWDLPQKCARLFKYGHAPLADLPGLSGCYATHLLLRGGTSVVRVPDSLADAVVAPANCALATMVAATESRPSHCHTAVIQGAGLLGLYACALLHRSGVSRVIVTDVDPRRLELVRRFGGEPALGHATALTNPGTADLVIEAAGTPAVVKEGFDLLRPGGQYTWVGMVHPHTALELTGESIIRKCLRIQGVHNYAPRHLREGVRFLHAHATRFPWEQLVSPPFALQDLNRAFAEARAGNWARVSVRPDPRS